METTSVDQKHRDEPEYDAFMERLQARFQTLAALTLFQTDVEDLWSAYLEGFEDPAEKQYHNCHACQRFIERFGGLVVIGDDGKTTPAMWDVAITPEAYVRSVEMMSRLVRRAKVVGVFYTTEQVWGTPQTGVWTHFAVVPPEERIFKQTKVRDAFQAAAEKREDVNAVQRALAEFSLANLDTAVQVLESDALYRSEKVLGQATWLRDLQKMRQERQDGMFRRNLIWRAVVSAPAGFCHPRASMIGTLLEDIEKGLSFEAVSNNFAKKMHPLKYQRPTAAPTAGAIAAAEKLVADLGIARSLARRFARMEDIQVFWQPKADQEPAGDGSVFGHLKAKGAQKTTTLKLPEQVITWEKFQKTVLLNADRMQLLVPSGSSSFSAYVTAVEADAPPILQWDDPERRNPVSWYFWNGGAMASQFGLKPGTYVPVTALSLKPCHWYGGAEKFTHQQEGVMFVLEGAGETRTSGNALFPEILRAELHGARKTMEAHANSQTIAGKDAPHVAGFLFDKKGKHQPQVRVWVGKQYQDYRIDRWD